MEHQMKSPAQWLADHNVRPIRVGALAQSANTARVARVTGYNPGGGDTAVTLDFGWDTNQPRYWKCSAAHYRRHYFEKA